MTDTITTGDEPTADQLMAEAQDAAKDHRTKRERIEVLEAQVEALGNQVASLNRWNTLHERRLDELEAREFRWEGTTDDGLTFAYGPRSGRLYSVIREFNGEYLLNWPGGTLHCKDRDQVIYMATLIERSWSPEEEPVAAGAPDATEGEGEQ